MSTRDISVVAITARRDFPFLGRPDLHCLAPVAETLRTQTFPADSFELVFVDALWETRGDWFAAHPQPYRVKHVPASPNHWHARGRPAPAAQHNRGVQWADGELIVAVCEGSLLPPGFLTEAWLLYNSGLLPSYWYVLDRTFSGPAIETGRHTDATSPTPVEYNLLGYTGRHSRPEHRLDRLLAEGVGPVGDRRLKISPHWFFGSSAYPRELARQYNGPLDEALDGDSDLEDVDFGARLGLSSRGEQMIMSERFWAAQAPTVPGWDLPQATGADAPVKCNLGLLAYNVLRRRQVVNQPHSPNLVGDVGRAICANSCVKRESCAERRLLWDPEGPLARYWLEHLPDYDWAACVRARREGQAPFDRAYLHEGHR